MNMQLQILIRRGLTLPEQTLNRLRTVGIWCDPNLRVVKGNGQPPGLRGQESGGAVADIGRYVSFCKEDGTALPWLFPVKNFMPNGLHAVVLVPDSLVRLDMYRYETSYDLLITVHTLKFPDGSAKPKLWNDMIFFGRFGTLERELWGKDKMFRGGIAPRFFQRSGQEYPIPDAFRHAVYKMTEAVTCTRCHHQHLLEAPAPGVASVDLGATDVPGAIE